jgi:hypothetical protein
MHFFVTTLTSLLKYSSCSFLSATKSSQLSFQKSRVKTRKTLMARGESTGGIHCAEQKMRSLNICIAMISCDARQPSDMQNSFKSQNFDKIDISMAGWPLHVDSPRAFPPCHQFLAGLSIVFD